MEHSEFKIGGIFYRGLRQIISKYRVTDVGTRTVAAIKLTQSGYYLLTTYNSYTCRMEEKLLQEEEAEKIGCYKGPPYDTKEWLFNEQDQKLCYPTQQALMETS